MGGRVISVCRIDFAPPIDVCHADGEPYAIDDTRPHQDAARSGGRLKGCLVGCPLRAASFDLRAGAPARPPAPRAGHRPPPPLADRTAHPRVPVPRTAGKGIAA
ncbi:Rieske 2Fe-2S domain-containing protein [Streptomyces sp. NPDC101227]|uniref:Rieske 2Fe-2S domain-containing protein n=1 Tax=Streptomyces sp. NPDC101227 TaxID=3366136 RepID=UPI0037F57899